MKDCMITFRSVTPAQRAEGLARRAGLDCNIQRTPKWMESLGCGYCLRLRCTEIHHALELLHSNEVPYRKVYLRRENGKVEEMHL